MTTFLELRGLLSTQDLRDPNYATFDSTAVGDMLNAGLIEVGRIAPQRFQEDIAPVANQLTYQLQASVLPNVHGELQVVMVEVWDASQTPDRFLYQIASASAVEYMNSSAGWRLWGNQLSIPNVVEDYLDPTLHLIRVWGYRPYPLMVADADVVPVSPELERAIRSYAKLESLERLNADRELFTQWQTRSNNSDISPTQLMGALSQARDAWRRKSRDLFVLRESPS